MGEEGSLGFKKAITAACSLQHLHLMQHHPSMYSFNPLSSSTGKQVQHLYIAHERPPSSLRLILPIVTASGLRLLLSLLALAPGERIQCLRECGGRFDDLSAKF
jgi:hypothetical protein